MKNGLVITGMLIALIGLVSMPCSSIQHEETSAPSVKVEKTWSISDTFHKGQILTFSFSPHPDWKLYPYPGLEVADEPPYSKYFMVNIKNTYTDDYTSIKVVLAPPVGTIPGPPYDFELGIYDIKVEHHGAITIEDYPDEITGIAKDDGLYSIDCSLIPDNVLDEYLNGTLWNHPASKPQLTLEKVTIKTETPYELLFPIGVTLTIVGAMILVWGSKSKQRTVTRRKVRR